mmetsp:Transcript_64217/g.139707  ORF Transcript_64217/g.139707 Transcript_64217/m.139707 type:complete len:321 (-) Transcript_64217:107-1069(-)
MRAFRLCCSDDEFDPIEFVHVDQCEMVSLQIEGPTAPAVVTEAEERCASEKLNITAAEMSSLSPSSMRSNGNVDRSSIAEPTENRRGGVFAAMAVASQEAKAPSARELPSLPALSKAATAAAAGLLRLDNVVSEAAEVPCVAVEESPLNTNIEDRSPGDCFRVELDRGEGELGLVLDNMPGFALLIVQVAAGPAKGTAVEALDEIIEVNGERNCTKMIEHLRKDDVFVLLLRRPFVVQLLKTNGSIGVDLTSSDQVHFALIVKAVKEGPLKEWNAKHKKDKLEVKAGDRIVAVNGKAGPAPELLRMIYSQNEVELTVCSH